MQLLGIGVATLDIINEVDGYPPEDAEVRALHQRIACGGNAANTLSILSILGHRCAFGGVLAADTHGEHVRRDLERRGIHLGHCRIESVGSTPTSYVCLNRRTGSRTIVHYRDLPEYGCTDFERIDLSVYDWLHFEGRNVSETHGMMMRAARERPELQVSMEIEKPRRDIERLFEGPRLLLFSQRFAFARGFEDPCAFLRAIRPQAPHARLVCAWGREGAYGLASDGTVYHSPARPPPKLVDTLGAGDTFNAGIIDGLLRGLNLENALDNAVQLAGEKCGRVGLHGLISKGDRLGP